MPWDDVILLLHAAATAIMAGLIWFVQIVHYPLMRHIGPDHAATYARLHQQRTSMIVGPAMLVEAGTAAWIALHAGTLIDRPALAWIGLGLVIVIWASTALIQIPQHRRLLRVHDPATIQQLVRFNWLRTIAWSARLGTALSMLG